MKRKPVILLLILISGLIILFISDYFIERFVKTKLEEFAGTSLNGKCSVIIEDVHINYLPLSMEATNLKINTLTVDSSTFNLSVSCSSVSLVDIDLSELIFNQRMIIDKVVSIEPVIDYNGFDSSLFKGKQGKEQLIDSIFIHRFEWIRSTVNYTGKIGSYINFSYKSGSFYFDNLAILLGKNELKLKYTFGSAVALFRQMNWSNNEYYSNIAGRLLISFTNSLIEIDTFHCKPVFLPKDFANRYKFQTDQFNLLVPSIRIRNVDCFRFVTDSTLNAGSCTISNAKVDIYRDKSFRRRSGNIASLQDKLLNAGFKSSVDLITVKNSTIIYRELEEKQDKAGVVSIEKVYATVDNFCTGTSSTDTINMDLSGRLMGGDLVSVWRFPLGKLSVNLESEGTINQMNLVNLNPITRTNAGLTINSGYLKNLKFHIKADQNSARGQVSMKYHSLNISIEDQMRLRSLNKLADYALNKWLIRNSSPENGLVAKVGEIYYPNNPERFFINYSLKALLSGVKDIVISSK